MASFAPFFPVIYISLDPLSTNGMPFHGITSIVTEAICEETERTPAGFIIIQKGYSGTLALSVGMVLASIYLFAGVSKHVEEPALPPPNHFDIQRVSAAFNWRPVGKSVSRFGTWALRSSVDEALSSIKHRFFVALQHVVSLLLAAVRYPLNKITNLFLQHDQWRDQRMAIVVHLEAEKRRNLDLKRENMDMAAKVKVLQEERDIEKEAIENAVKVELRAVVAKLEIAETTMLRQDAIIVEQDAELTIAAARIETFESAHANAEKRIAQQTARGAGLRQELDAKQLELAEEKAMVEALVNRLGEAWGAALQIQQDKAIVEAQNKGLREALAEKDAALDRPRMYGGIAVKDGRVNGEDARVFGEIMSGRPGKTFSFGTAVLAGEAVVSPGEELHSPTMTDTTNDVPDVPCAFVEVSMSMDTVNAAVHIPPISTEPSISNLAVHEPCSSAATPSIPGSCAPDTAPRTVLPTPPTSPVDVQPTSSTKPPVDEVLNQTPELEDPFSAPSVSSREQEEEEEGVIQAGSSAPGHIARPTPDRPQGRRYWRRPRVQGIGPTGVLSSGAATTPTPPASSRRSRLPRPRRIPLGSENRG